MELDECGCCCMFTDNMGQVIVANGGKKQSDIQPESDFGLYMHAEDTEGNPVGIYTMKKKD